MATKISNCGINENGKTSGGLAGDQNGREYRVMPWYSRPWKCVLRHPDAKVREEIARISAAAANNDNIGYCQEHRATYFEALRDAGYEPKRITEKVEADCSASTLANIIAAGYHCHIVALMAINHSGYTGNMRKALIAAGFKCLTDKKYLTSSDYLLAGDVLLNDGVHAAVNLEDGEKANGAGNTAPKAEAAQDGGNAEKTIWTFLIGKGLNAYAAAGVMGNLYAESGLNPKNLQNSYEKKFGLSDEEYTARVDAGTYTNFVRDCAGYGLAQWTYWARKQGLYNKAKKDGKSVGDLNMQLAFLWEELQGYKKVMQQLKAAGSVEDAAKVFMTEFEKPRDQSEAAKKRRAQYGQTYFDKYAGSAANKQETTKPSGAGYITGKVYTLQANMYVRTEPRGKKKTLAELTADGRKNAYKDGAGAALLKKGTRVTVQGVKTHTDGSVWVKIPSGYVCGKDSGGTVYIS